MTTERAVMGLRDIHSARVDPPRRCKAAGIIDLLDDADREYFDGWAANPSRARVMADSIAEATGEPISDHTLARHVRGECRCNGTG